MALNSNYLLVSESITVFTDHQALVSISKKNSMLNHRILRFLETLSTYPVEIKYIKGVQNVCADFLSRFNILDQHRLELNQVFVALDHVNALDEELDKDDEETLEEDSTDERYFRKRLLPKFNALSDKNILEIKELLKLPSLNNITNTSHAGNYENVKKYLSHFILRNDTLYYIHLKHHLLKVISTEECVDFFEKMHAKFHGTPNLLINLLVSERMFNTGAMLLAIEVVRNCKNCDLYQRWNDLPQVMRQIKTPETGEIWHIDFVGSLGTRYNSNVNEKYVLVAVEYVIGYCYALSTTKQNTDTVKFFLTDLFTIFSLP